LAAGRAAESIFRSREHWRRVLEERHPFKLKVEEQGVEL
jgi:hypothetical protein